jgi:hypothetical protein
VQHLERTFKIRDKNSEIEDNIDLLDESSWINLPDLIFYCHKKEINEDLPVSVRITNEDCLDDDEPVN